MDIINLAFVNVFPFVAGGYPGTNFGNQCDGNVYTTPGPLGLDVNTQLLSGCHQIWEDLPVCKAMGKTVLLSLGGDSAWPIGLTDTVAESFADFLWYSFGPLNEEMSQYPRPFQNSSVDGFDFDIEHNGNDGTY